jgi:hypothetical protein
MYHYTAYGLIIRSEFKLPELPSATETDIIDATFRQGDVTPVSESVSGVGGRRIDASPREVRLTYDSIGSFRVDSGEVVVCDPLNEDSLDSDYFRRLIENEMLGLLLYQRDHLVVHASAVAVDGKGAIFLGPRGAGKSTTAAAMHLNGHQMLEDDVVGIRLNNGAPEIVPGVPQSRLRPDAANALGVTDNSTPATESWYEKRFLSVSEVPDPVPLTRCYILQQSSEPILERYTGQGKILELISSTHARGLLPDTDQMPVHFDLCSRVAENSEFRVLRRTDNHESLHAIVNLITNDIRSHSDT